MEALGSCNSIGTRYEFMIAMIHLNLSCEWLLLNVLVNGFPLSFHASIEYYYI